MTDATEPPSGPAAEKALSAESTVAALEARLGMRLPDPAIALAAVTHKSYVNEHRGEGLQDNERLEFLGDAVIDLAVSHRLMERFPAAREGELSKIRAALVDEAGLARMARELDLGPLLRLGRGEVMTGGREKSSLLADAMEAVIAALYLSGGVGQVLSLLDRFVGEAFARAAAGTLDRDYKTQFQELAQSRLRASPRYRVVAEHGPDHSKVFDVELELRGEVVGRGVGRSKKDAEQAAAKLALEAINGRLAEERGAQAAGAGTEPGPRQDEVTERESAVEREAVAVREPAEEREAPAEREAAEGRGAFEDREGVEERRALAEREAASGQGSIAERESGSSGVERCGPLAKAGPAAPGIVDDRGAGGPGLDEPAAPATVASPPMPESSSASTGEASQQAMSTGSAGAGAEPEPEPTPKRAKRSGARRLTVKRRAPGRKAVRQSGARAKSGANAPKRKRRSTR